MQFSCSAIIMIALQRLLAVTMPQGVGHNLAAFLHLRDGPHFEDKRWSTGA